MARKGRQSAARTAFYDGRERRDGSRRTEPLLERFSAGVSLHGHTWHSHENLAFLPATIGKVRILPRVLKWAEGRYERRWRQPFEYSQGYWTSPVSPAAAYALETRQIETRGLRPFVSLTDHDSIVAHGDLSPAYPSLPISFEWTAPYRKGAVFHIGVHNLPPRSAERIVASLRNYTAHPSPAALADNLAELHALTDVLIVLNHPLSDQGRIGFEVHEPLVREFLEEHGRFIHALETNALQPHGMNRRVEAIARGAELPVVSGGDRHGFEPNGALNLTNARTFAEFVREVREDKVSHVLYLPHYYRPLKLRYSENVRAVMGKYPALAGHVSWHDRVFYRCPDGVTRSISEMAGRRRGALGAMDVAVGALGVANQLARPLSDFE